MDEKRNYNPVVPAISFQNYSFVYEDDKNVNPAISDISFDLFEGETLILAGPSGSGKSTISYAISGIIPWRTKGYYKGDVKVFGKSTSNYDFIDLCKIVSVIKQNPLEQLVTFTVRDEIAFGLENLKLPKSEIETRVQNIANIMGITHLLDREIDQLSGGQKQLTILSSFLIMNPKILILDEPIAYLDQKSESLLLNCLRNLISNKDLNLTILIIEHRLSRVLDIADKLLVLDDGGKVALKGEVSDVLTNHFDDLKACNVRVPWLINLFNDLNKYTKNQIVIKNSMNFEEYFKQISNLKIQDLKLLRNIIMDREIMPKELEKYESLEEVIALDDTYVKSLKHMKTIDTKADSLSSEKDLILETKNLSFTYPNGNIHALNKLSIKIQQGDFVGLVGPNGSGKTTLLYLLANLYQPTSGEIFYKNQSLEELNSYKYAKKIGFIFQNPENMIFKATIKDELLYAAKNFGILDEIKDDYLLKLLNLIGKEKSTKNPFNLSWGQKRRLNLSSIFIYNPEIILLDEPFIGQDQRTIDSLIETLFIENKRGKTIIISSHDYHLLLKYTRRIIELNNDGSLQNYDTKKNYFSKHSNLGPIILINEINKLLMKDRG